MDWDRSSLTLRKYEYSFVVYEGTFKVPSYLPGEGTFQGTQVPSYLRTSSLPSGVQVAPQAREATSQSQEHRRGRGKETRVEGKNALLFDYTRTTSWYLCKLSNLSTDGHCTESHCTDSHCTDSPTVSHSHRRTSRMCPRMCTHRCAPGNHIHGPPDPRCHSQGRTLHNHSHIRLLPHNSPSNNSIQ